MPTDSPIISDILSVFSDIISDIVGGNVGERCNPGLPPKSGTMLAEVKWAAAAAGGGEP